MSQSISVISEKRTIVLKNSGFLEKKVNNISCVLQLLNCFRLNTFGSFFFSKKNPTKQNVQLYHLCNHFPTIPEPNSHQFTQYYKKRQTTKMVTWAQGLWLVISTKLNNHFYYLACQTGIMLSACTCVIFWQIEVSPWRARITRQSRTYFSWPCF